MTGRSLFVVVVLLVLPARALAHDFWLYPATHQLKAPGPLDVQVFYGMPTEIDELERRPSHIKRFEAHGAAGVIATTGKTGDAVAGHLALAAEDIYTLIYESHHNYVQLEPEKFKEYLAEEGLTEIIAEREQRKETGFPGNDGFARYAKALVKVGDAATGYDRKIGLALELVAVVDPSGGADGKLKFQLWYQGKPHGNAVIDLFALVFEQAGKEIATTAPGAKPRIRLVATAKTDAQGFVDFPTPPAGRYMVTALAMQRSSGYPVEAEWESFWASLSFEVEPGTSASGGAVATGGKWGPRIVFASVLVVLGIVGFIQFRRRARRQPA